MIGTLINTAAIIVGSLIGFLAKKGIPERMEKALNDALGVSVLVIGIVGIIKSMITVNPDFSLSDGGTLALIISLVVGAFLGEILKIEDFIGKLGYKLENRLGKNNIAKGFVSATILFCVGAMAILGAINDGLNGDYSILVLKSALDGVAAIILTATLGMGVIFAAASVLIYQGIISLCAGFISPFATPEMLSSLSMVGYAIILCIGLNFLKITKIKTANLLPSLVIIIVFNLLLMLKTV